MQRASSSAHFSPQATLLLIWTGELVVTACAWERKIKLDQISYTNCMVKYSDHMYLRFRRERTGSCNRRLGCTHWKFRPDWYGLSRRNWMELWSKRCGSKESRADIQQASSEDMFCQSACTNLGCTACTRQEGSGRLRIWRADGGRLSSNLNVSHVLVLCTGCTAVIEYYNSAPTASIWWVAVKMLVQM